MTTRWAYDSYHMTSYQGCRTQHDVDLKVLNHGHTVTFILGNVSKLTRTRYSKPRAIKYIITCLFTKGKFLVLFYNGLATSKALLG